MSGNIRVTVDSSRPLFISATADDFGATFAAMDDGDQVEVFVAMVKHMRPHRLQWDYIAIKLAEPEYQHVRDELRAILRLEE